MARALLAMIRMSLRKKKILPMECIQYLLSGNKKTIFQITLIYCVNNCDTINLFCLNYHSATIVPNAVKADVKDGIPEGGHWNESNDPDELENLRLNGKIKYFPKMFVTVIYIVILVVSFGTILVQLMIFAKGL